MLSSVKSFIHPSLSLTLFSFLLSSTGVGKQPISKALPNVDFEGACTWHIMALDFPKNLKHLPGYAECKKFVYDHLVHNTVCKDEWERYLAEACRKWPGSADYLQTLAKNRDRWGSAWRLEHFTLGMEASSMVEGSFSSFHRALGESPRSFAGVVQQHVRKDEEKLHQERMDLINAKVRRHDKSIRSSRTDAVNQCAELFADQVAEKLADTNVDAQDYTFSEITPLTDDMIARGASKAYSVCRRIPKNPSKPAPPRTVLEINGVLRCSCKEDFNSGEPDRHVQCVLGGAFKEDQFHDHWRLVDSIEIDDSVPCITDQPLDDNEDSLLASFDHNDMADGEANNDGVGEFVREYAGVAVASTADNSTTVVNPTAGSISTMASINGGARQHKKKKRKKKKMLSTDMYNDVIKKATTVAGIVSRSEPLYQKLITVLDYVVTNIQNDSGEELKAATASYLGFSVDPQSIEPSTRKRVQGSMSTKRKRSGVETHAFNSTRPVRPGNTCDLCKQLGHHKGNCPM